MSDTTLTPTANDAASSNVTTRKPIAMAGWEPAPEIESFDTVPWFRRAWFAFFPLFVPATLVIALTGIILLY